VLQHLCQQQSHSLYRDSNAGVLSRTMIIQCLHDLRAANWIVRAGVASVSYVCVQCARPWCLQLNAKFGGDRFVVVIVYIHIRDIVVHN
jgi:hypothetical protein